jgi:CheY-like chemotaxis protein
MAEAPVKVHGSPGAAAGNAAGRSPAVRNRVLVADDVKDSADALASLLESKGHEVRIAYDGEAAVQAAREFHPDVVVLDIGMPALNGYEAARQIRAGNGGGKPPVLIALTGWGHEADRALTKEAGFDHHLVKPIEPAAITKLVSIS